MRLKQLNSRRRTIYPSRPARSLISHISVPYPIPALPGVSVSTVLFVICWLVVYLHTVLRCFTKVDHTRSK